MEKCKLILMTALAHYIHSTIVTTEQSPQGSHHRIVTQDSQSPKDSRNSTVTTGKSPQDSHHGTDPRTVTQGSHPRTVTTGQSPQDSHHRTVTQDSHPRTITTG